MNKNRTTRIECVGRWHDEIEGADGVVRCANCEWDNSVELRSSFNGVMDQDARIADNLAEYLAGDWDGDVFDVFEDRDPAEFI